MIKILGVVLVAYLGLIGVLWIEQRDLMYHPDVEDHAPAGTQVPEMQEIDLLTKDGQRNESWFHFPADSSAKIIVYMHGNGASVAARDVKVRPYIDAGLGVVLVGYRGYGGNMGRPTEAGLYEDARAVLRDLTQSRGLPESRLVLYGESLGTGVATKMATEFSDVSGLVLEVPFDSALAVAQARYPYILGMSMWMADEYRSDRRVAGLKMPKLFLIAGQDKIIPPTHARRLFDLAADPKQKIEYSKAGHDHVYDFGAAQAVIDFIAVMPTQ